MNYTEFRKEYAKALKKYPDAGSLYSDTPAENIEVLTIRYEKTGSRWSETEKKIEMVDFTRYLNIIAPETVQFFRNLGGYERITTNYTKKGLLPVESVSISPARDLKTVRTFFFK